MAEQDKYGSHFGSNPNNPTTQTVPIPMPRGSGAEQDRFNSHWGTGEDNLTSKSFNIPMPSGSGAEQDRYASHFSPSEANNPTTSPIGIPIRTRGPNSGAEQDVYGSHFNTNLGFNNNSGGHRIPQDATAVGILKSTLLPSLGFHGGLAITAYTASRIANRVDGKDYLWPAGQVANAWWSAVGTRVLYDNVSFVTAFSSLVYPEKVLLTGVTAWGAHLFYQVASRAVSRGSDDTRYTAKKQEPGFWNKAFFNIFAPEALFQAVIALPFTMPFRAPYVSARSSLSPPVELAHDIAVFVFSAGFALEVLADYQLNAHKKNKGNATLNSEGIWSIVRHPNYLGDTLVHASFPLFLWGSGKLHPITLLGPAANYIFLRYIGGDEETEASQESRYASDPVKSVQFAEYKRNKNSFWPSVEEFANSWTLAVIGAGAGGVLLERVVRHFYLSR